MEVRIGNMIGVGELAARETLSTIRYMMKLLQQMRQISTTGDRIVKGIRERWGYRYYPRTEAKMPTPTPTVVDSNTLPTHPQAEGRTTK